MVDDKIKPIEHIKGVQLVLLNESETGHFVIENGNVQNQWSDVIWCLLGEGDGPRGTKNTFWCLWGVHIFNII